MFEISSGKVKTALKIVVYGPEGIGKSTFASYFPEPLFVDTEGSTKHMDIKRLPSPSSWTMLMDELRYIRDTPNLCKTIVLDTADWAEKLCIEQFCASKKISGIEDIGYGKGYVYIAEDFGKMLNILEEIVQKGIHVVITAHAQMRKFEQPDELGAYDRWELKLQKKIAPLLKEWADMVLFANYQTLVVNIDGKGNIKGKNKAQGGQRVMYTTHHPCWDAKNRFGLQEQLPFDFKEIAHVIDSNIVEPSKTPESVVNSAPEPKPVQHSPEFELRMSEEYQPPTLFELPPYEDEYAGIPQELVDLMKRDNIRAIELQNAVADRGYYPADTRIQDYDVDFIKGALVPAWSSVVETINKIMPF